MVVSVTASPQSGAPNVVSGAGEQFVTERAATPRRSALALLALIAVVALFFTRRISERQPGAVVAGGSP